MKNRFIALGVVLVLAVSVIVLVQKRQPDSLRLVEMVQKDMVSSITEKGRVQSVNEYVIVAKSEGHILSIPIKEGAWVVPGKPLVIVDTDLCLQKLKESQAQLSAREVEFRQGVYSLKTKKMLLDAGALSQFDYDDIQKQVQLAQSQLTIAQVQVASAKIQLRNQMYVSPEYLQVTKIAVEKGAVIVPNTFLMQLADPRNLKVEIRVKEFDAPFVKAGQVAWVSLASNKRICIKSTVTQVQPILEKVGETYAMKVRVAFSVTQNTWIKPGSQVDVQVITGEAPHVWTLPQNAIFVENGHYFVQVKSGKNIQKKLIKVGIQNTRDIEIKSGLMPHEKVILP